MRMKKLNQICHLILQVVSLSLYSRCQVLTGEQRKTGIPVHSSALATALVRRSGRSPAEPYPPVQRGHCTILPINLILLRFRICVEC